MLLLQVVSLPNSYVETLIPTVTTFGDGTFGRKLGLDEVIRVRPAAAASCNNMYFIIYTHT